MFDALLKRWKLLVVLFVVVDLVAAVALLQMFFAPPPAPVSAAEGTRSPVMQLLTMVTSRRATPWAGPGKRNTPTPIPPPTPLATDVLAASGFPPGFTPTPRPTRETVMITLPYIFPVFRNNLDVPVINQIYYPEPFFPPGTNNACGPVALFAALQALALDVDYSRLRDVAVGYGFTSYGISKNGMINTAARLNQEAGERLVIDHGSRYNTQDLIKQIRTGGVVIVLIHVRKSGGRWYVTGNSSGSIGHFLIVDSINLRTRTVKFAGSTLGMDSVPLQDFLKSWSRNPPADTSPQAWQSFLKNEPAENWALVIRRKR